MDRMHLYSFQGNGTWVPVGECQTDAMALALLAKKVGGKYALVGNGEPAYLMKKSIDGREHANSCLQRVINRSIAMATALIYEARCRMLAQIS